MAAIRDKFSSLDELHEALNRAGLESSNLILGIDFTSSNTTAGKNSFGYDNRNLHLIRETHLNPYERAISAVVHALEPYDDDGLVPVYGFGDGACWDGQCRLCTHHITPYHTPQHRPPTSCSSRWCLGTNQPMALPRSLAATEVSPPMCRWLGRQVLRP